MLKFISFSEYQRGTLVSLLSQSYADYFQFDPNCELAWKRAWEEYDLAVFEHPDTVGSCGYITAHKNQVIGFASWDPRQFPIGVIGHNCVLPEFRGNSYGNQQIIEVIRNLRGKDFVKAQATTGEHSFFESAKRMYKSCGFIEVGRGNSDEYSDFGTITFERSIDSN